MTLAEYVDLSTCSLMQGVYACANPEGLINYLSLYPDCLRPGYMLVHTGSLDAAEG